MESATKQNYPPNFILSPHQQDLLFAALNSNKPSSIGENGLRLSPNSAAMGSIGFTDSPLQQTPGSGALNGLDESPFVDYDYDFDADGSFEYDYANDPQGLMIGRMPGSSSDGDAENHDKRGHPDDENDEDGGGKRREGDDKSSKKPGRKPLTSEPTSKRKAQNRAAQRAFRERKEKHLKDLETKVQDLEKASEEANHENNILRAQIEKMAVELREYRKRMAVPGAVRSTPVLDALPPYLAAKSGQKATNSINDVNFQFEFPQFGQLPGPISMNGTKANTTQKPAQSIPGVLHRNSSSSTDNVSPLDQTLRPNASFSSISPVNTSNGLQQGPQIFGDDLTLFNSPSLDGMAKGFSFEQQSTPTLSNPSRSSSESANGQQSNGQSTYSSPSASSGSNAGLSSSCGTSPEPYSQSPAGFKANDNLLTTIGEENNTIQGEASFCEKLSLACGTPQNPVPRIMSESGASSGNNLLSNPSLDVNGIDWLAQQNNYQFDPQLFGDYREPQTSILSGGLYDDTFFADAFALPGFDTNSPFNLAPTPEVPKKDLIQEIDQRLQTEDEVYPAEDKSKLLTCNTMWEKIQSCPSVQNGHIDMDDLCSQLQSKAKCSGDGPVIAEQDFKEVIHTILSKPKDGQPSAAQKQQQTIKA